MIGRLEQCHLFVLAPPPVSSLANCSLTGPTLKKTALQLYIVHLLQTMTFNKPSPSSNSLYLFFSLATCIIFYYCIILMSTIAICGFLYSTGLKNIG